MIVFQHSFSLILSRDEMKELVIITVTFEELLSPPLRLFPRLNPPPPPQKEKSLMLSEDFLEKGTIKKLHLLPGTDL